MMIMIIMTPLEDKIPSEMEVAPRYKLLALVTLVTLVILVILFIVFKLFLHCLYSSMYAYINCREG